MTTSTTSSPSLVSLGAARPETFQWLYRLLRRWVWLLILSALAAGLIVYEGEGRLIKPTYEARAFLQVMPSQVTAQQALLPDYSNTIESTEASLVTAYPVAQAAYRSLGLGPPFSPSYLQGVTLAQPVANSQLIEVSVASHDPLFATHVANAMATAAVHEENRRQASRYASALAGLQRRIKANQSAIVKLRQQIAANQQNGSMQTQVAAWQSQVTVDQTAITNLQQRQVDLQATAAQSATTLYLSIPAQVPTSPVSPHPRRDALVAAIVALVLAASLIVVRDQLTGTLRSPEEVSLAIGGAPVLGAIPRVSARRQAPALAILDHPRSQAAESYRMVRTNLLFSNVDSPPRIILVTSAQEGEGKSTAVLNLAASIADTNSRVLILDADLRRPTLHKVLQTGNQCGLTSTLVDVSALEGAVQRTSIPPNVSVLTSGPLPPNPAELLSSHRMERVMAGLLEQFDVIVVDSPPLLPVADAAVLARYADFVLLVVEVRKATRHRLTRAREVLDGVGAQVSGILLNKLADDVSGSYYYRRYYGHGESYTAGDSTSGGRNGRNQVARGEPSPIGTHSVDGPGR